MSGGHFGGIAYAERAHALSLHLSIGAELVHFAVDDDDLALREISRLELPAPIQYVWAHPTRNLLYVASSNRSISKADDLHTLSTVELDDLSGAMRTIGEVALPSRPIHLTSDARATCVLVVYNAPSGVTSHPIDRAGVAGPALAPSTATRAGTFPHQVLMLPSGRNAVIVARGNHGHGGKAEEPGSLELLSVREGGALSHIATVAPGGGHGFGPRHLDFHPSGRWAAVSVERQNELQVFEVQGDLLGDRPACTLSTLDGPSAYGHDQLASTIRFHPGGRYLYVVNRNDVSVYGDAARPSLYDGNNIAVYAFDEASGQAVRLQQILTESIHVRTFSLDAGGRLLVAASILPALAQREGRTQRIPARLSFFRVGDDGRLTLACVRDMESGGASMFWSRLSGRLAQPG